MPLDFEPEDLLFPPVDFVLEPEDLPPELFTLDPELLDPPDDLELLTEPDFPLDDPLFDPPDLERTPPDLLPLECEPEDFFW